MKLKTKYFGGWLRPETMESLSSWLNWIKVVEQHEKNRETAMVFFVPLKKQNQVAIMVEKFLQENEKN